MNKYEKRAQKDRKGALRAAMLAGTIGLVLIAIALAALGLSSSASFGFYRKAAIAVVVLLLIFRQVGRRLRRKPRGPAQPDEKSQIKLH